MFRHTALEDIRKHIELMLKMLIRNYYESEAEFIEYFSNAMDDIVVRLDNYLG